MKLKEVNVLRTPKGRKTYRLTGDFLKLADDGSGKIKLYCREDGNDYWTSQEEYEKALAAANRGVVETIVTYRDTYNSIARRLNADPKVIKDKYPTISFGQKIIIEP